MSATLRVADEKGAYILVDRGTYLFNKKETRLEMFVEGIPDEAKENYIKAWQEVHGVSLREDFIMHGYRSLSDLLDYSFEERQAFLDGCDGHEVDLSVYDTMLEDNNG